MTKVSFQFCQFSHGSTSFCKGIVPAFAFLVNQLKMLLGRFVTVSAINVTNTVVDVDFISRMNQISNRELMVGFKSIG